MITIWGQNLNVIRSSILGRGEYIGFGRHIRQCMFAQADSRQNKILLSFTPLLET
jgi:hypothetical protein